MTGGRSLIALAVALALTAGLRDAWDDWVAATVLPPVLAETSVEVRARDCCVPIRSRTGGSGWRLRWRMSIRHSCRC